VPLNAEIDALLQPYFGKLRERHFKIGIFNHPNEFGLPTIKVNIQEPGKTHTYFGMACHPDKNTALIKAFCEALQSRVTMISGARDDIEYSHYTSGESATRLEMKLSPYENIPSILDYFTLNDTETLHLLKNKINKAGFEHLIFVDLTQSEINIPIVVAVVPGFQMSLHHPETSR
jgi:YcaO-like protein with predicted kinase domain